MTDTIYLEFSPAEQAGRSLIGQAQHMDQAAQVVVNAMGDLYASGLRGTFASAFDTHSQELLAMLHTLTAEYDEAGRDLLTVVQRARELDEQMAARWRHHGESFDAWLSYSEDALARAPITARTAFMGAGATLPLTGSGQVLGAATVDGLPFYDSPSYMGVAQIEGMISEEQSRRDVLMNEIDVLKTMRADALRDIEQYEAEQRGARGALNWIAGVKDDYAGFVEQARARIDRIDSTIARLQQEVDAIPGNIAQLEAQMPQSPLQGSSVVTMSQGAHLSNDPRPRGVAVDLTSSGSMNVHSLRNGTVVLTGEEKGGYGHYVKVLQDDGVVVLYAHLDQPAQVQKGQTVSAGAQLGIMGDSGYSTGPHLHMEFRQPDNPDPAKYRTDNTGLVDAYNQGQFDPQKYLAANGVTF